MSDLFDSAWAKLKGIEGDHSDDPNDSGGATRWGVTEAMARKHGYQGDMRQLPADLAREICKAEFWDVLRCDDVGDLSASIAYELLDTGYNMGPTWPGKFLQTALNAFNRSDLPEPEWPELKVDGAIGDRTIAALDIFLGLDWPAGGVPAEAPETIMMRALNAQQGVRYLRLAAARHKDEKFVRGWFLNRVE